MHLALLVQPILKMHLSLTQVRLQPFRSLSFFSLSFFLYLSLQKAKKKKNSFIIRNHIVITDPIFTSELTIYLEKVMYTRKHLSGEESCTTQLRVSDFNRERYFNRLN